MQERKQARTPDLAKKQERHFSTKWTAQEGNNELAEVGIAILRNGQHRREIMN